MKLNWNERGRGRHMIKKIENFIRENGLLEKGDKILLGLSGGGDSMALLSVFSELKEEWELELHGVHVHHGIRGEEADRDEELVRRACEELQIPYTCYRYDVQKMAREEKMGVEEAGRKARNETFEDVLKKWQGDKIALAHHKNDLAETMLHHLARGTGLRGIGGIRPMSGKIIRPLLCLEKKEIEHYLKEKEIPYGLDSTNLSDSYTRNRIRHQVLNTMVREVNQEAVAHLAEAAEIAWEADEYLRAMSNMHLEIYSKKTDRGIVLEEEIFKEPHIIRMYVYQRVLELLLGNKRDISRVHMKQIETLIKKNVGKKVSLPYELEARRTYGGILFARKTEAGKLLLEKAILKEPVLLHMDGPTYIPGGKIISRKFAYQGEEIPEKTYTKWFDYGKIKKKLCIRPGMEGDFLIVNREGNKKKLNRYFVDHKVPREDRNKILLIAEENEILWVLGMRISEKYKVTNETKEILELRYEGGK